MIDYKLNAIEVLADHKAHSAFKSQNNEMQSEQNAFFAALFAEECGFISQSYHFWWFFNKNAQNKSSILGKILLNQNINFIIIVESRIFIY